MTVDRGTLKSLFEGAPRFVERLVGERASDWQTLFDRAEAIALEMPEEEQVELLNAHPRIGAAPGSVSALSFREQGYDHDQGGADLQSRLDRLNAEYESRHGFRFVIFVNGRSRGAIAGLMPHHIEQSTEGERERALRDVVAIARDRFARLREEQSA